MMLPAGPAQARLSSRLSHEVCAAAVTVFGAVAVAVVISVPLPWRSDPDDDVTRHSSKEKKLHETFFQDDMFLFYIIGRTGTRAKILPSQSRRKSNQENYVRLEWAQSWGLDHPGKWPERLRLRPREPGRPGCWLCQRR